MDVLEDNKETVITLQDFPFICRICCLKQDDLRPFDKEDYLFDLFHVIRKIDVDSSNSTTNFPRNICDECVVKLEDISMFIDTSKYNNLSGKKNSITVKQENECKDVVKRTQEDEVRPADEHQWCRLCLSPNGKTLLQEKPQMVQLLRDLTDIDVTQINSQNGDIRMCDKCSDELEEISSFLNSSLCNDVVLENILRTNYAVKTEKYSDSSDADLRACNDVKCDEIYGKNEKEHEIIDITEDIIKVEVEAEFSQSHLSKTEVDASAINTEKSFQCYQCDEKFADEINIRHHLLSHTTDKRFECEVCRKRFSTKEVLKRHTVIHMERKPFECDYCKKSFLSYINLQGHLHSHTGDEPFECYVCKKKFGLKQSLSRHLVIHRQHLENDSNRGSLRCHICEKFVSRKDRLKRHMLIHTGEKAFECEVCGKRFAHRYTMKRHVFTHMEEKPFKCQYCEKSFSRKISLQNHLIYHTENKPFGCNVCQKKFTLNSSLKRHLLVHSKNKQVRCENTENQKLIQSEEKVFQCNLCEKRYTRNYSLKRHSVVHYHKK